MVQELITAGKIVGAHGIRGEVKLLPQGIDASFLARFGTYYIDGKPIIPAGCREHKGCLLVKLPEVEDMDAALALKGKAVAVRRQDGDLPDGVYFDQELVGLTVRDAATGEPLGKVDEVLLYPAHKIYAVRGGKDEYLIPAVSAFVKEINITDSYMEIHLWEGLGSHED